MPIRELAFYVTLYSVEQAVACRLHGV